jgi:hypothetical protein
LRSGRQWTPDELKAIIDDGVVVEEGSFLVRVEGVKDESPVRIDSYTSAHGLVEAFATLGSAVLLSKPR